ncbi:MAG: hypothetical protein COU35_00665 [Candidatus Magasanikbacteria bacterium CG10_big_fil_rev_8_21_14_0_10_47_10]|uniref:DDH domain-containing protein n=1 Tax=Candidatus Magasanikbacteria bacterium CG10_big_fil_rev_8_21_14_0_10_47_10 TaxID=1974652 RepID=A0A2H0TRK0_9BACT|nr:MAG: hypothetical protein COU35_00665 [Candidatus Magasanikbacteria bacterium CG10_big_fil_rev_8_21_14_0_10_47_10]
MQSIFQNTIPLAAPANPFRSSLLADQTDTVREIHRRLKGAQRVLIATHEHPDGDAAGSSLALLHALRYAGKQVVAYIPDPAPDMLSFLPAFAQLTCDIPDPAQFDTVVVLDATYVARTHLAEALAQHPAVICIDHHYDNQGEGQLNLVVPEAAATAHILAVFFLETDVAITTDMATCLLTGIFTDTGSFMHDSTSPDILQLASFLMSRGARLSHIAHETYQKKELSALQIWGRALSRIMITPKGGAAVSVVTQRDLQECRATLDDLSGVVNMLNTLPDTSFALLLCEHVPGKIKGSLRSEPHKHTDVSAIAKALGGGGHKLAAGFEIEGRIIKQNGSWRIVSAASSGSS